MSPTQPTTALIGLLKKQAKLEDESEALTASVTAATTCTAASQRLQAHIKLEDAGYRDGSFRDPIATMRERLLEINDELRLLAIRKKVWRDRDTRLVQKRIRDGEAAYAYSAR
ncbi:hypothetical protein MMC32_001890 [Xylographa parallela]|nr:hypothetical protein [Xylographa parallela]